MLVDAAGPGGADVRAVRLGPGGRRAQASWGSEAGRRRRAGTAGPSRASEGGLVLGLVHRFAGDRRAPGEVGG
jgi:hypothetical protein